MTNKHTLNMMAMLPQWMKMAKDTESVGAKFLDAFGVELGEMERYLEETWNNFYIGTANLQRADYCYKIPLSTRDVTDVEGEGLRVSLVVNGERLDCQPVSTLRNFFEAEDHAFMLDEEEGFLYIRSDEYYLAENIFHPFDAIDVSGALHFDYMLHHIWNIFDEFGMLLGVKRLPGERNEPFKNRILDVFKRPGGANKKGLQDGISRELGLEAEDVFLGALTDANFVSSELMNSDGTPTQRYIGYVNQLNENLGFSWDHMNWGEAYWRSVEENNMGFHYLPHIWDGFSADWKDHEIQSGVGSGDDLKVHAPKREESVREFKAFVGLHGTEERVEEHHPELRFKYKIVAKGKIPNDEFPIEKYRHTIVASEIIPLHYVVRAMRSFLYRTHITWDERYGFTYENPTTPGIEVVTGETALHNEEEAHIRLHVEMKTADRRVTPVLEELIVDWTDQADQQHSYRLTTDADFTQQSTAVQTTLLDVEASGNRLTLGKGSFSAVVDTVGSFSKGEPKNSVKINDEGSISLDLPNV